PNRAIGRRNGFRLSPRSGLASSADGELRLRDDAAEPRALHAEMRLTRFAKLSWRGAPGAGWRTGRTTSRRHGNPPDRRLLPPLQAQVARALGVVPVSQGLESWYQVYWCRMMASQTEPCRQY